MTMKLLYIISFVICSFFTTFGSVPVVIASEPTNDSTDNDNGRDVDVDVDVDEVIDPNLKTAMELGYGVNAYECDKQLKQLPSDKRAKKEVGTMIQICFVPNLEAIGAKIGLNEIHDFVWDTTNKDGEELSQEVIQQGKGDGVLSAIHCLEGNDLVRGSVICVMECMLGSEFYFDTASVIGTGEASLDGILGTVPLKLDIFQVDFSFKFTNGPDGEELTDEETKELLQNVNEHNAAIAESNSSSVSSSDDDDDASVSSSDDDMKKENNNEEDGKDEL